MGRPVGLGLMIAAVLAVACDPIVADVTSQGPKNSCKDGDEACARYDQPGPKPSCDKTCVVLGKPSSYVLAIAVPESSFFAPGRTFLVRDKGNLGDGPSCGAASCIALPPIVEAAGEYRVTPAVAEQVGYPLGAVEVLPARVAYFPQIALDDGTTREASDVGLPALPIFADIRGPTLPASSVRFLAFVPLGSYRRVANPTSPFDLAFPPSSISLNVAVEGVRGEGSQAIPFFTDRFVIGSGAAALDDPSGESNTAVIRRRTGLDGFYTYLRDRKTERRLSSLRALGGTTVSVRLDTVGENTREGALRDGIDIVVVPDPRWIGVPTLVDRILAGAGFRLDYPDLPPPVPVAGVVDAEGAVPAQVTFVSTGIEVKDAASSSQLLYSTTVRTDAEGRFSTVLPAGTYEAFVEPEDRARAFAKTRVSVTVSATQRAFVLRTRRKPIVSGKVRLSDGRPLSNADLVWAPSAGRTSLAVREAPRPARATTDGDGLYAVALDQGEYDLTVIPEVGTGFPRLVLPASLVGPNDTVFKELVVFAPSRIAWTVKAPGGRQSIVRAVVRAFAFVTSPAGDRYVEIGQSMTDENGAFEMLVGPYPK